MTSRMRERIVLAAVALTVGSYYLWQARAGNGPFEFRRDLNGYYDLLARGFVAGHLYTVAQPSPQLLALPNPWDPKADDSLRWQDMVLYNGHYYLYFGAAPAALLFAPWRILARHDLPENFAIVLLCFGGFLFSCGALRRVLDAAGARPGPVLLGFAFLALGVCQSAPFLLNRAAVYEIAIASGYFFVSGGLYFLSRGKWAASGAMFGLAVASRPHLLLAGAVALGAALLTREGRKGAARFFAAWAAIGLLIGVYNYERFGNPLEFGFRYQLAGPGQNRVEPAPRNVVPGVYFMLLSRPEITPVFPWMRMVYRFPFDSAERHPLPPDYFLEPTVGALWLAPFLPLAFFARRRGIKLESRWIVWTAAAAGIAVLLFLVSTHLMTHRYEVDFAPLLVFAAVAQMAMLRRKWAAAAACVAIAYSATANLAVALAGPYDDYLRTRPQGYVRLAQRFSPAAEYRPELNPPISLRFDARLVPEPAGYREPLVTIGHSHYCYFLYAVRGGPTMRLVSKTEDAERSYEMPEPGEAPVRFELRYTPADGVMSVRVNGRDAMTQKVGTLVAAPAGVAIGENYADMGLTARRLTGAIGAVEKAVGR